MIHLMHQKQSKMNEGVNNDKTPTSEESLKVMVADTSVLDPDLEHLSR